MTGAMSVPARAGADLRLLRAAAFAAVCVTLAAAGHEMASGAAIPGWALLTAWAGVFAVAAPLAGRERSLPGIAALMLAGQLALHLVFSAGQWSAAETAASGGSSMPGMRGMRGMAAMPGMPGMRSMPGMAGMSPGRAMPGMPGALGGTVPMLCVHLAAGLIAGWLLWRGEAALWRLVRLSAYAASRIAVRFPLVAAVAALRALRVVAGSRALLRAPRRRRGPDDVGARPESAALRHCVVRRGPPGVPLAAW